MRLDRPTRPLLMGSRHVVSAGHYLAAEAGMRIFARGGNAIDAGVAAGLAINVVQSDLTNLGGVAPIMIRRADGVMETIAGVGTWPAAVDVDAFRREHGGRIPRGVRRSIVPAALAAWTTALERHGSLTFGEVAAPALELAEDGFAMHDVMRDTILDPDALPYVRQWPGSRAVFLDAAGDPLPIGARVRQPVLARTFRRLIAAEQGAATREAGLAAVRDLFYRGDIAEEMVRFSNAEGGWLSREDLAIYRVEIGVPLRIRYRDTEVYACGPWCQGLVVPETLAILERYPIGTLEPFGADHLHLVLEALKAAFADRERYIGDPRFVEVPIEGMLSRAYAEAWQRRIDPRRASEGMPEAGDAWAHQGVGRATEPWAAPRPSVGAVGPDTSYVATVDAAGNIFSATPSDAAWDAPFVPGLGITISGRGTQSFLAPGHPSVVAPGKRPRLTPSPGIVTRGERFAMAYGTPGLDVQPQAMVQMVVGMVDFGLDPQVAIEAPRVATYSFPASSDPHPYQPGLARGESRLGAETLAELARRGHRMERWPAYARAAGSLGAAGYDRDGGYLFGAADTRRIAYAIGR